MSIPFFFETFDAMGLDASVANSRAKLEGRGFIFDGALDHNVTLVSAVNRPGIAVKTAAGSGGSSSCNLMRLTSEETTLYCGVSLLPRDGLSAGGAALRIWVESSVLAVRFSLNGIVTITYTPSGVPADNINTSFRPVGSLAESYFEIEWLGNSVNIYRDCELILTKSFTVTRAARHPHVFTYVGDYGGALLDNFYCGPTRLGDIQGTKFNIANTTTTGEIVGAATAQLAIQSFDKGTSYVELGHGTGEVLVTDFNDLGRVAESILGMKLTYEACKSESGLVPNDIIMEVSGDEATIGSVGVAVGYGARSINIDTNPVTGLPFTPSELTDLTIKVVETA